jgi:hypothetical protein
MAKVIPLKRMTAAEAHRERTRLRITIGSLALARMTAQDVAEIDARLVKLRRRIARLDRRIRIASAPTDLAVA